MTHNTNQEIERLQKWLYGRSEEIASLQTSLTGARAVGPENGGPGEMEKALLIEAILASLNIPFQRYECPDPRVEGGARPNIVAILGEKGDKTLWLFAHMDVVPPGDAEAWTSDPFVLKQSGDLVFGRGTEDNQQAIASMLILAEGLRSLRMEPPVKLGLVFMADEERGSHYGLEWLLETHGDIFSPGDYFIAPDGGSPDGDIIEIAEKAQLWLKFTVSGKQCHASIPQEGRNALVAGSRLILELVRISQKFNLSNPLFLPPMSTFTPTMREANVPAVNILPGKDVFYMDCRLLPGCDPQKALKDFESATKSLEDGFEAKMEVVQWQPATFASPQTEIVKKLKRAIFDVYGVTARPAGIGGATVASFLRKKGFPAVVWSCIRNTCHQPNEYSSITATLKDAAVFGRILFDA
ncbi:MAG: M20 family metallo-hydrolase [Desulfovibrio sp.]|nr:M20 family metallo-hydrolase [Desulfovibrio sp.]